MPPPRRGIRGPTEITVKFVEGRPIGLVAGKLSGNGRNFTALNKEIASIANARLRLRFPQPHKRLKQLQENAGLQLNRTVPFLNLYVRLTVPATLPVVDLLRFIRGVPGVEWAEIAGSYHPAWGPDDVSSLPFLADAPEGVGARYAWEFAGGDGAGVSLCVCDWGYDWNHTDLPGNIPWIPAGSAPDFPNASLPVNSGHGTSALGASLSPDESVGTIGIAHQATGHFTQVVNLSPVGVPPIYDAVHLIDAVDQLPTGSVLLVEIQTSPGNALSGTATAYRPVEYNADDLAAIVTAVGNGITVVLPAGNGSMDLADLTTQNGKRIWDPESPDYFDSGAILVGAGYGSNNWIQTSRARESKSNFGDRIDCQGWGTGMWTPGWSGVATPDSPSSSYHMFNNTSGAAAMIAGVAASLQGAALGAGMEPILPPRLREILACPWYGSPQPAEDAESFPVGPLPDLRQALRVIGVAPDLLVRDSLEDDGSIPYGSLRACQSPDIIVGELNADPVSFAAEDLRDVDDPGYLTPPDPAGGLFARLRNRSTSRGTTGTVTFYQVEAGPYLPPDCWRKIGTLKDVDLAADTWGVYGPQIWAEPLVGGMPALVTVVSHGEETPITPWIMDGRDSNGQNDPDLIRWTVHEYAEFLRCRHDVAIRNVQVLVASDEGQAASQFRLLTDLQDAWEYRLVLTSMLPVGSSIAIEGLPAGLGLSIEETVALPEERVGFVALAPCQDQSAAIRIHTDPDAGPGDYPVTLDQFVGDSHLGCMTWRVRIGP